MMLCELGEQLWAAVQAHPAHGVPLGDRMTIIRLASGELLLHGPIACTQPLRAAVEALGPIRYLCVPNRRSGRHLLQWAQACPAAESYGAPGLDQDEPQLELAGVLGAAAGFGRAGELEQVLFEGIPMLNEVVFFHPASRTLLLADLAWHLPPDGPLLGRGLLRLNLAGLRFGPARDVRLLLADRRAAARSLDRILRWDFERVVVRRGPVLEQHGKRALRRAYDWLSADPPWWR